MMSFTSPPEQKARPVPVITTARTESRAPQRGEGVAQLGVGVEGQRVEALGPVEADRRDAVVLGVAEVFGFIASGVGAGESAAP